MSLPRADYLIVSCEHGGNRVPSRFRRLLSKRLLATHRGYDPGALALARDFAAATGAPLFHSTISRLLVELNRPPGHPLVSAVRAELLEQYYFPYWRAVETSVGRAVKRGRRVLHLSVHSFTPRLLGVRRTTDIGLLFDPRRRREARFCERWQEALQTRAPRLRVRHNDPYRGDTDSLVSSLRKKFAAERYLGIALEINQRFPRGDARRWRAFRRLLRITLVEVLALRAG